MVLALCLIETKIGCYFPDLTHTKDCLHPDPRCVSGGWMEIWAPGSPRLWPLAATESTTVCLGKPCWPYSRICLDLGAIYHRVKNWSQGREEEKEGCAVLISITTCKKSLAFTTADILLLRKKIKSQFSVENFKRMVSASECRCKATFKHDCIVEENNFL